MNSVIELISGLLSDGSEEHARALALLGFIILFGIGLIVIYILGGLGLRRLANREGFDRTWRAFVPFVNLFLWGQIIKGQSSKNWAESLPHLLVGAGVGVIVFNFIPFFGQFIIIASLVVIFYAAHLLYDTYTRYPFPLLLASIFSFGLGIPIIMFFIRNSDRSLSQL
ncbi:hypothetical protein HXA32_05065 [Salipaludibacillus agaradhaerens]|uniref:hypothetical protein n=1 Tax=Salipaludibacillus agaradhaerens TaxID=76935 RepID=UPI00215125A2|nr:hypothetical protein [Salipaludibacillus agaradhaerens]MCR6105646.1 hypothetical protein [Salipaludibacillus agaradhaerens]